jgi:uncharacterized protein with GYD domain
MSLYFLLGTLTENGQRMLLRNPDMMIEAIRGCDCEGAQILGQYAVLGKYDYVMIAEADDNEAVARLALEIGVKSGLHTETLPAMAIGVMADEESDNGGQEETRFADLPSASGEEWRLPGRGS